MKAVRWGVLFLLVVGLAGCFATATYGMRMTHVDGPDFAQKVPGKAATVGSIQSEHAFMDDKIVIAWLPADKGLAFALENKTDETMRVLWDRAAIIDPKGVSHGVFHSGVAYTDRASAQLPSVVPKKTRIEDMIWASSLVKYYTDVGWVHLSAFPATSEEETKAHVGEVLQVLLPIEIDGQVTEYTFAFEVADARWGS